jgi:hypothetical protein
MVYDYVVTIKNKHNRYVDVVGILLSLFSVVCFTWQFIQSLQLSPSPTLAPPLGVIAVLGFVIWNLYQAGKGRKVYYSRALLIAALVWMKMPYFQWLVFVFIILALLEYQAKHSLEIGFSDKQIFYNSLFKKIYNWNQFSNIVLKDNLLTLDFTNNRLLQLEVEDDEESEADEEEFNEYCQKQLANVNRQSSIGR